jgi:uncharacterized protein with GYD domain
MKYITFARLTDEGRKHVPEAREVLRQVNELVSSFDGKIEGMWATTGHFDFVVVVTYPAPENALKAHTKLVETGYFLVESTSAFDMDTYLTTV